MQALYRAAMPANLADVIAIMIYQTARCSAYVNMDKEMYLRLCGIAFDKALAKLRTPGIPKRWPAGP